MLFRRISYRIALQFMVFVFLLLLVNGAFFLALDFSNVRRQAGERLERTAHTVLERMRVEPHGIAVTLPPMVRERVRIVDMNGDAIYSGGFFENIPFSSTGGLTSIMLDDEQYDILTTLIDRGGRFVGYMQIAEINRLRFGELPLRALIYFLVSLLVSALTFGVGLFFARRSLKPAEQMMERLEQFTQDASHELRTPLATLNSSIDLALKTQKYREGLESAKEDVRDLSLLIERLLELARLDNFLLQTERVDLSALIQDAVERCRPLAAKQSIEITGSVLPGVAVQGDPALLRQILTNLLSNAIKFSKPGGGTVTVTLTPRHLTVEDTGIGIPSSSLPRIFHRFYQAESSRSNDGFGLGLALVKRIVDLHGWTIDVRSAEGKGTAFTIRFS